MNLPDIRHPEELSLMVMAKTGKSEKHSTPSKGSKHHNSNGTQEDGLLSPNILTPGLTPMSPYTPGAENL